MSSSDGFCTILHKDSRKKTCEKDPKFAFKQYNSVYHACFKHAASLGPYGRGVKECYERLKKWDTESLRTAALKGKGDDTIEYCLRLLTGAKAPVDEETAYALLRKVVQSGQYTSTQRAVAANLACTYFKRGLLVCDNEGRNSAHAFVLADISCKYGLFTWSALHLIQIYEEQKENPETKLSSLTHLWREYAKYREETGMQRMTKNLCSKCGEPARVGKQMKACSGECTKERKPVYCGRVCQKAAWPKHKKWCKPVAVEWTTDYGGEDWVYNDDSEIDKFDWSELQ